MHQSSMEAMARFVSEDMEAWRGRPCSILDVGSMDVNGSYRQLFDDPRWTYVGMDAADGRGVDIVLQKTYDWSALRRNSYDVVISGQAFEHIEFPWVSILELARVLRPGGVACIIVPSNGYEHRYPFDCWRYYPDGIAALARWADLDVRRAETNWEPRGDYADDSARWMDTVLVATKRASAPPVARLKAEILRRVVAFQAARRQAEVPAPAPQTG